MTPDMNKPEDGAVDAGGGGGATELMDGGEMVEGISIRPSSPGRWRRIEPVLVLRPFEATSEVRGGAREDAGYVDGARSMG
jgi:hypothetical protein